MTVVLLARPASSQTTDTITVEARGLLTGERTAADVRRRAVEDALAEAVRRVAGLRVQSSATSVMQELGSATRTANERDAIDGGYVSVVQIDAAGRVVDYRMLDEEWQTVRHPELGSQVYLRLRLLAVVALERGVSDPGFSVEATLNAPLYFVHGDAPPGNDEIVASIRSSRAAYLTIFSIADDSAQRLLPNEYVGAMTLGPGIAADFPDDEWRERGLRLRAALPRGRSGRRELLMVVATRDPVDPPPPYVSILEVQRWLVRIPMERRAIAFTAYEVRRK